MTRAKERLKQLETQNKTLENEVVKLRQQIAILDHIVKEKKGKENVAEGWPFRDYDWMGIFWSGGVGGLNEVYAWIKRGLRLVG
jgi:hypothetical protein